MTFWLTVEAGALFKNPITVMTMKHVIMKSPLHVKTCPLVVLTMADVQ